MRPRRRRCSQAFEVCKGLNLILAGPGQPADRGEDAAHIRGAEPCHRVPAGGGLEAGAGGAVAAIALPERTKRALVVPAHNVMEALGLRRGQPVQERAGRPERPPTLLDGQVCRQGPDSYAYTAVRSSREPGVCQTGFEAVEWA